MRVRKLRSVEDLAAPTALPLDEGNIRSAIELSELCSRLHPVSPPRGVQRFASVDAAWLHRCAWESTPP